MTASGSWDALSRWYDTVGPEMATIALLRVAAVALTGWLLLAGSLQVLGAIAAPSRLQSLADRISPRSLQRLGHGLAGLSLTAGLAAPAPGAGTPAPPPLVEVPASAAGPVDDGHGTATMHLVEDGSPASMPAPTPVPPADPVGELTVGAGDSFWSIAVEELSDPSGNPPSDRQVAAYWRRLIDANRSRLVDPGNPDLLYPGQMLTLPPA